MKGILLFAACFSAGISVKAQAISRDSVAPVQFVDAACGRCLFGMKDDDCKLAVRLDGTPYYVDGAGIDDFGDAHQPDGFCNVIRRAAVTGRLVNKRFKVTSFKLLPQKD